MNPFDKALYHAVNNLSGHVAIVDAFMKFIASDALEIYAVLFLVAWFTLRKEDGQTRHGLIVAGCSGILALVINVVIGHIWYRPRPFVVLPNGTFHQLIPHSQDSSFPSDHASGSFAFAFGSRKRGPKWVQRSFLILAILVAFARVYVGVHWPTDVLAGVAIGWVTNVVTWRLERYIRSFTKIGIRLFRLGKKAHSVSCIDANRSAQ